MQSLLYIVTGWSQNNLCWNALKCSLGSLEHQCNTCMFFMSQIAGLNIYTTLWFQSHVCEVKTNLHLFAGSFNGYHAKRRPVNTHLPVETVTAASETREEKLDADVWYSLSYSCHFFLVLSSISPATFPPPFHATFGSSSEQSTSTVMKLLPHFPTPFCHTPARWNMHQTPQ